MLSTTITNSCKINSPCSLFGELLIVLQQCVHTIIQSNNRMKVKSGLRLTRVLRTQVKREEPLTSTVTVRDPAKDHD